MYEANKVIKEKAMCTDYVRRGFLGLFLLEHPSCCTLWKKCKNANGAFCFEGHSLGCDGRTDHF